MIGERFGPYQVLRQIAGGSASRLFLASDGGEVCVVKVFSRHAAARAERELRFGGGLDHPRLNRVDELVDVAGHPAVRMPFVPGVQLSRWMPLHGRAVRRGTVQGRHMQGTPVRGTSVHGMTVHEKTLQETTGRDTSAGGGTASISGVVEDVLNGLAYLHSRGTVHRDVKPENILVGRDDRGTLVDYDLAAHIGESLGPRSWAGTAAFLSPERVRGAPATPADDLYAAGLVLYWGLTGALPSDEASNAHDPVPAPPSVRAPEAASFDAWVVRALAPDPGVRFASAVEMRVALEASSVHERQESRSGRAG